MTAPAQDNKETEQKPNDKEYNFRQLEAKYQRQLAEEKGKREEAERLVKETMVRKQEPDDDDESEPYVDHKKLNKKLTNFGQATQTEIQKAMQQAKEAAKEEVKQELWLENNPDFYDVLKHADKFAEKNPRLAESILRMPECFERQKLVYQNIKALEIDKPPPKQSAVQDKIEANKRSPYYQPSGVAGTPYNAGQGDFSPSGQKNAYSKMQELKKRLSI